MKKALLSYDAHTDNIGDYVQSIATLNLIGNYDLLVDREKLDEYDGEEAKIILNGWFMTHPDHWPPSPKLKPLFISFHINPTAEMEMLTEEGISYLKEHEPIGCRDYYTLSILHERGIEAYFSGCNTLTIQRKDLISEDTPRKDILVCGVLDRIVMQQNWKLKPASRLFKHNLTAILKYPSQKIRHIMSTRVFQRFLKKLGEPVRTIDQILDLRNKSESERLEIAKDFLKELASAKLVITSRIHTALPCVALGTPVIFIEDGLEHINQFSRLIGLNRFFYHTDIMNLPEIELDKFSNPNKHHQFVEDIKTRVEDFIR
ncbi:polysaccharide pyruvyl transferase family protein [Balneola sp. MJW-20]|uniref:polysaccharide pyruvyl transferase family protein n=1 Tax=Gracilimonas aurantiaca TaxID=3234185 RepID=UPI003467B803